MSYIAENFESWIRNLSDNIEKKYEMNMLFVSKCQKLWELNYNFHSQCRRTYEINNNLVSQCQSFESWFTNMSHSVEKLWGE